MNPYLEDGPCARLSFDPAYCKRCTGPPSVNDGYITGPGYGRPVGRAPQRPFHPRPSGTGGYRCHAPRAGARPAAPPCGNAPPRASPTPRARPLRCPTLSPRLKLSFGNAATGPL